MQLGIDGIPTRVDEAAFKCPQCPCRFWAKQAVQSHVRHKHSKPTRGVQTALRFLAPPAPAAPAAPGPAAPACNLDDFGIDRARVVHRARRRHKKGGGGHGDGRAGNRGSAKRKRIEEGDRWRLQRSALALRADGAQAERHCRSPRGRPDEGASSSEGPTAA